MIRIAITAAAYPSSRRRPRTRLCGPSYRQGGHCLIHVEAPVLDRLRAMRGLGESYSEVILRLVEMGAERH